MSYHFQKLYFEEKDEIILQNQGKIPSAEEWILSKKMSVIMKGCILMNRIKSFCKGVDQINSLLIKKNIEILCQSMTFSVLELQRGYIYQLYQNGLEFHHKVIGGFLGSSSLLWTFPLLSVTLASAPVVECAEFAVFLWEGVMQGLWNLGLIGHVWFGRSGWESRARRRISSLIPCSKKGSKLYRALSNTP